LLIQKAKHSMENSNSVALRVIGSIIHMVASLKGSRIPDARVNLLFAATRASNPLRGKSHLPEIDVVIPFVEKDLQTLPLVIEGVSENCSNPISRIRLVTPRLHSTSTPIFKHPASKDQWKDVLNTWPALSVEFDDQILGSDLWSLLKTRATNGWNIQQLVKFAAVMSSSERGTLVIDADTVLTQPKTWLDSAGRQLLQIGETIRPFYTRHFLQYFGFSKSVSVGFITHHQLMQRAIVYEMFPNGVEDLSRWFLAAEESPDLRLSEYDSYGTFLTSQHRPRAALGSWANISASGLSQVLASGSARSMLSRASQSHASVSFHSYQLGNGEEGTAQSAQVAWGENS